MLKHLTQHIIIDPEVHKRLAANKDKPNESFNAVLRRMLRMPPGLRSYAGRPKGSTKKPKE